MKEENKKYNHINIEKKIQEKWKENKIFKTNFENKDKEKFYLLDMFSYPSGDGLHMGHTEQAAITDTYYRYKKMKGFNVLHPQGFDAFGLPAENYAIKTGIHPEETISKTTTIFKEQMDNLGLAYDFFNDSVITSKPEYYKWTQSLFGKFFENDLVYKKTAKANWCSSCNTIIANEQIEGGKCERCKTEIEQKDVPSWMFRITDFADDLIWNEENEKKFGKVDWPGHTKKNQNAWIGKSVGAKIKFQTTISQEVEVFTTRPDTLFGATYMVLAPEHNLVQEWKGQIENWDEVEKYIQDTKKKTELDRLEGKEKTGVELKGVKAVNPVNQEELPIFISDYVLAGYGTGAIMAVPAHDERDYEFAEKFGIEIKEVVAEKDISTEKEDDIYRDAAYGIIINKNNEVLIQYHSGHKNYRLVGGGIEKGENKIEALKREIIEETEYCNVEVKNQIETIYHKLFHEKLQKTIRGLKYFYTVNLLDEEKNMDIFEIDKKMTYQWISKSDLKKHLESNDYRAGDRIAIKNYFKNGIFSGNGILVNSGQFDGMGSEEAKEKITEFVGGEMTSTYRLRDWSISRQRYWGTPIPIVYDPEWKAHFVGEENLPWKLPTDVDFVPTGEAPLTKSKELKERVERIFGEGWTPEVDTMDTFVDSSWYFLRYPDPNNENEFASQKRLKKWMPVDLYIGGAEHTYMHLLYARFFTHAMHKMGLIDFNEPFLKLRHQGMILDKQGKKMSKSKGNVVNPDEMVERFGADATRAYMLFAGPIEDDKMWNEDNIVGIYRWIEKVWRQQEKLTENENLAFKKELHKTIKSVGGHMENLRLNVTISDMMKLMNFADKEKEINKNDFIEFIKLASPIIPHVADEILGEFNIEKKWPIFDTELVKEDSVKMGIQINGKRRAEIEIAIDMEKDDVFKEVLKLEEVQKWVSDKEIKKFIYVPKRIISIII